ncbi:MAG TPA: insulinase family protein [Candidatus Eisenbacteria bacterium]|jgi:zinc protease
MIAQRVAGLALAGLAAAGLALGAGPARARLSPKRAETWSVDRGTTAVLIEDHRAPLVEVRLMFPIGLWSPWAARVRRLDQAFALSMQDPGGALRARADRLGVEIALTTDARMSVLSLGCRSETLDSALALARDVLANRDLDRGEIARRNFEGDLEWSAAEKDPQSMLRTHVRRLLFVARDPRRTPYERPEHAPGDPRALTLARDTLVRCPGRAIGLAGDVTRARAEAAARALLPAVAPAPPSGATPAPPLLLPADRRPREVSVRLARLTQVYLALAREGPALTDRDYPAFLVADHVLGGHFYSRLYQALRHGEGDTYATGTIREAEPAPGAYAAWTYSRNANAAVAESKLRGVLRAFHDGGITEEERADAAGYLRGRRAFAVQSPGQVLDRMLWDRSRDLPPGYRDALVERAAALPLAEINEFIRRFYDPARFTLIRVETK